MTYEYTIETARYKISSSFNRPITKGILHLPTGVMLFYGDMSKEMLDLLITLPDNLQTRGSLISPVGTFRKLWITLLCTGNYIYNSELAPSWEVLAKLVNTNTLELIDV